MTRNVATFIGLIALACMVTTACLAQKAPVPPQMPSPYEVAARHAQLVRGSATVLTYASNHYESVGEGLGVAFRLTRNGSDQFAMGAARSSGLIEGQLFSKSQDPIFIGEIGFPAFVEGFIVDPSIVKVNLLFEPSGVVIPVGIKSQAFVLPVAEELKSNKIRFEAIDSSNRVVISGPLPYPNRFDSWSG